MLGAKKSGEVIFVGNLINKTRQVDENMLPFSHWQRRKSICATFAHEIGQDRGTSFNQCRPQPALEKVDEVVTSGLIQVIDCANHKAFWDFPGIGWGTAGVFEQESRPQTRRAE